MLLSNKRIDGVDIAAGLARFDDDVDMYMQIAATFVKTTPPLLETVNELYRRFESAAFADIELYAVTVHGLKGCCYSICATNTGNKAYLLEMAAKSRDMRTIRLYHRSFISELEALISGFSALIEEMRETVGGEVRAAPDRALLVRLLDACNEYNTSAMEDLVKELKQYSYERDADVVAWLDDQLNNLEYDLIRERLEQML
jgi:HPt (histidine-containing phosphotransfer) domain-containing protein